MYYLCSISIPHRKSTRIVGMGHGIMTDTYDLINHLWYLFFVSLPHDYRPNLSSLERLRTLIDMFSSNLSVGIADAGHLYAMMASASSLTSASRLNEIFHGMTQVNKTN